MSDVEKVKAADPKGVFYEYEAGHGFNCDQRPSFNPAAAALARQRTLEFFGHNLTGKKA
jgi:carboxymethylenebutenolidase